MIEILINDLKSANKARKQKLAEKYGFNNPEEYLEYLTKLLKVSTSINVETKKKLIIHNVTLLDATRSMQDDKYNASIQGIHKELTEFKSTEEVTILHSVFEFIDSVRDIKEHFVDVEYPKDIKAVGAVGQNTPLWYTTETIINRFRQVPKAERVLLKVYTDGGNNIKDHYLQSCNTLIKRVNSENFTVTFVGTKQDLKEILSKLSALDESNTLEIDNTGKGFEKAFEVSNNATRTYINKAIAGEDVLTGFYKNIGEL